MMHVDLSGAPEATAILYKYERTLCSINLLFILMVRITPQMGFNMHDITQDKTGNSVTAAFEKIIHLKMKTNSDIG